MLPQLDFISVQERVGVRSSIVIVWVSVRMSMRWQAETEASVLCFIAIKTKKSQSQGKLRAHRSAGVSGSMDDDEAWWD